MFIPKVFDGGKLVILTSDGGEYIDLVLFVDNYDERMDNILKEATYRWNAAADLDYRETVCGALHEAGYIFKVVDNYVTIDDQA